MNETPRDDSPPVADPYHIARFLHAQNERHAYASALEEIRRGRKVSHWIWFVFPQIAGLGHSATSKRFAIRSLEEARAYLAHPVRGVCRSQPGLRDRRRVVVWLVEGWLVNSEKIPR